jgi:tRNA threonylcarbamoyladenosine biosynthesis protein TsaB
VLALVIDTSSAAVTAGVVDIGAGVVVLAETLTVDARAHGELLAPSIKKSLDSAGKTPRDLDAIIAGVGPGPFTGLRVGLVTAAAMSDALQIPAYGVCSLDGIAVAVSYDGPLLVAGDARRKEVYWARYLGGVRDGQPHVGKPADLVSDATAMVGAGARMYAGVFGLPLLNNDFPTVAGLAAVAAERVRTRAAADPLTPLYLRRPDAMPPAARAGR